MCYKLANDNNCEILHCEEGYFSEDNNAETCNPLLIRLVVRKKSLAYYKTSKNYDIYSQVTLQTRKQALLSYKHMDIMNTILEKHDIKYIAVAGTVLGLNRHGGIIPWDDDIDIGFINSEWTKLISITNELELTGLQFRSNNMNHCHFGLIDCFKIEDKDDYFIGPARTYCHKDEYITSKKQIFGYTYICAPTCSSKSLTTRYGDTYFYEGDVNDNFHYKNESIPRFTLTKDDLCYQLDDVI
jgi:hypothetical protein